MRLHEILTVLLVVAPGSTSTSKSSEDFCSSPGFRDAFLDGRKSIDYPSLSPTLLGFGDRAIPCLSTIVENGPQALEITECSSEAKACQKWALGAVGKIGTPKARAYLRGFLRRATEPDLLVVAILSLGNLRDDEARPALLDLLTSPSVQVRSRAVLSLGVIGNDGDFEKMLAATLSLPQEEIYTAAQGLLKLGDPRAIEPLTRHAETISDPTFRNALESVVRNLKLKTDSKPT